MPAPFSALCDNFRDCTVQSVLSRLYDCTRWISYLICCYKGCLLVSFSPSKCLSSQSTFSKDIIRAFPHLHLIYISALFLYMIWALFMSFKRWRHYPTLAHEGSTYVIRTINPVQTTPTYGQFVFIALSGRLLFVPTATERVCGYAKQYTALTVQYTAVTILKQAQSVQCWFWLAFSPIFVFFARNINNMANFSNRK